MGILGIFGGIFGISGWLFGGVTTSSGLWVMSGTIVFMSIAKSQTCNR